MLKCRDLAEIVTPYLDGTLSLRARLGLRVHLLLCQACRHYLDQMRRTIRFLGSGPALTRPEDEAKMIAMLESAPKRD